MCTELLHLHGVKFNYVHTKSGTKKSELIIKDIAAVVNWIKTASRPVCIDEEPCSGLCSWIKLLQTTCKTSTHAPFITSLVSATNYVLQHLSTLNLPFVIIRLIVDDFISAVSYKSSTCIASKFHMSLLICSGLT